ncbi:MAG: nucleotidyltransferase domain-containing protein [Chitinophagaceae bacterium]
MELSAQKEDKKLPGDKQSIELICRLKSIIYYYDKNAEIILFGSRARGDWHEESDWDFLILTDAKVTENFKQELRNKILDEIEMPLNEGVFVIVKNRLDWEENYAVTNIYESIMEEGIGL